MIIVNEIWKPIEGYEGLYEVSNLGRVKSYQKNKNGHLLSFTKSTWGYHLVGLNKDGKRKSFSVHRLVATAFLPKIEGKEVINHIDCDKTNNHVDNLEWCTQKENVQHSVKLGHYENSGAENKPVLQIEKHGYFQNRFRSICEAARITGIPQQSISSCCNGKLESAGGYKWQFL